MPKHNDVQEHMPKHDDMQKHIHFILPKSLKYPIDISYLTLKHLSKNHTKIADSFLTIGYTYFYA